MALVFFYRMQLSSPCIMLWVWALALGKAPISDSDSALQFFRSEPSSAHGDSTGQFRRAQVPVGILPMLCGLALLP